VQLDVELHVDDGAPTWFKEAVEYLHADDLGDDWWKCVGAWVDLEKLLEYGISSSKVIISLTRLY